MAKTGEIALSPLQCQNRNPDSQIEQYLFKNEVEFIRRHLTSSIRPGVWLDLGCGSGRITVPMRENGFPVMGIDIDRLALATFQQRSCTVPLIQSDCLCLPFAQNSVDCIMAIHCFDHLRRGQFLQECNRVLARGSLLVFDILNRNSYKLGLKRLGLLIRLRSYSSVQSKYVNVFSWRELTSALANAGFVIEAIKGYGWVPFTVDSTSRLINAAGWLEQVLNLGRFPGVSPRILVAVRKRT